MREKGAPQKVPKARAFVKKADNRPSLGKRLKFWFWKLTHREG